MPKKPPSTKAAAPAKVNRVAKGLVAGKTVAAIAREEGTSREHISRFAGREEVVQRIASLVDESATEVEILFRKTLMVISEALEANDHNAFLKRVKKDGGKDAPLPTEEEYVLVAPPDHYARLTAAKRFLELMSAGRAPVRNEETGAGKLPTLDQIASLLTQAKEVVQ